jgi:hypothetical protein
VALLVCEQLRFLAVDGGGSARLHSFSGGIWRLDCTFRLLPAAVRAEATGQLHSAAL